MAATTYCPDYLFLCPQSSRLFNLYMSLSAYQLLHDDWSGMAAAADDLATYLQSSGFSPALSVLEIQEIRLLLRYQNSFISSVEISKKGDATLEREALRECLNALRPLVQLQPSHAKYAWKLSRALMNDRQFDEGLVAMRNALALANSSKGKNSHTMLLNSVRMLICYVSYASYGYKLCLYPGLQRTLWPLLWPWT